MADDKKESIELSNSPHIGGYKMSSSLKERLKRTCRIHSSPLSKPVSPVTPLSINKLGINIVTSPKFESPVGIILNENIYSYTKGDIEKCEDKLKLQEMYLNLQRATKINEEKLRKLKLVQKHHNKNKPDALVSLIQRWLIAAQEALKRLYLLLPEPKPPNLQSLINFLQIDLSLIKFNPENDDFF